MPSELRSCLVVDTAQEVMTAFDRNNVVLSGNSPALKTFGWQSEEVIGKSIVDILFPESERAVFHNNLNTSLNNKIKPMPFRRMEFSVRHLNGSEFHAQINITSVDLYGERIYCACVRDITMKNMTAGNATLPTPTALFASLCI